MLASQSPLNRRALNFLNPDSLGTEVQDGRLNLGNALDQHDAHMAEYEMVIRLERMRIQEALSARDVAVARLAEACASVREKTAKIEHLNVEKEDILQQLKALENAPGRAGDQGSGDKVPPAEAIKLAECMKTLENKLACMSMPENRPPNAKGDFADEFKLLKDHLEATISAILRTPSTSTHGAGILKDASNTHAPSVNTTPNLSKDSEALESPWTPVEGERVPMLPTATTTEKIQSRYAVLASLPLPSGIPNDALTPIMIPSPHTIHDFISTTSGHLRTQIGNYRIFQQSTTTWCPEREEHGYYLTPAFKCNTNPRVTTAHRWSAVDLAAKLDKPTECFFNKDGNWYYAGIYTAFRLDDLCPQEWECLSPETSQVLIRETLAGRKNTSPQNIYETGQLYSAGALKIACIGLQCTGFNEVLYRGLLEHAAHCNQTGKWRATGYGGSGGGSTGLGLGGAWNANTNANVQSSPSSPAATLGSPGQHLGRVPGLVSVTPSARNLPHGGPDLSATPSLGRSAGHT